MNAVMWKYKNLLVEGNSLAGVRTALSLPQHGIAFDVANGLPHIMTMKKFFISHGHMDHASGIPYVISQKSLQKISGVQFYMPEIMIEPMTDIIQLWSKLEGHNYDYEFIGLKPNDEIKLKDSFYIKCFSATHRIPALGYTLFESKKKLKPEFKNLTKHELVAIKHKNLEIEDKIVRPLFSFTGDTTIDVVKHCPWLLDSQVLFIEVTYLDDRKSPDYAKTWGHIHIDDLLPILEKSKCEKIVFIHISSRYSHREIVNIFNSSIPDSLKNRVEIFEGR
jgi:ribonuclease Z